MGGVTNNAIRDWQGEIIGYRCHDCGQVFQSMWGCICNQCRAVERRHRETIGRTKHDHPLSS